jgi:hypothetical protein
MSQPLKRLCKNNLVKVSGRDMRRIRALGAPGVQQTSLDTQPKHLGEEALHGLPREESRPELTQDRKIGSVPQLP